MINENQTPTLHNNFVGILAGMLIGGLAGAVTMLLLAPQSGEETRMRLQEKGIELRDRTTGMVAETMAQVRLNANKLTVGGREKIDEFKQHGKELAVEQLDRVSEVAEAGKKAIKGS
jgi:gas vesicle protein